MRNSIILLAAAAIALVAAEPVPNTRYKSQPKCHYGKSRCGSSCFDLSSNAKHCGSCNHHCGTGSTCKRGRCQCAKGFAQCHRGGGCVGLSTNDNCGRCGNSCATGAVCNGSSCVRFQDSKSIDFEPPTYHTGSINGQDGWSDFGAATTSSPGGYDQAVDGPAPFPGFGTQSFRISDAIVSGSFGDQAMSPLLTDSVGETEATAGTTTVNTRYRHFQLEFDVAAVYQSSTPEADKFGTFINMSPDRGDGSRMSALQFIDKAEGIAVEFVDYQDKLGELAYFHVPLLDRTKSHHFKLTMYMKDGRNNDIVCLYIDGAKVHAGTSWEDFYRDDPEQASEPHPRLIKNVGFYSRRNGTDTPPYPPHPDHAGLGFWFDNLVYGAY